MNVSYDTTLKKLLKASADSLLTRITGHPVHVDRWVETELRRTEHRQADLLGLTIDGDPIHIELQSTNDPAMPLRMAEYAIGIYRQFQRLPFQLVLYFGYLKLSMQDRLSGPIPTARIFSASTRSLTSAMLKAARSWSAETSPTTCWLSLAAFRTRLRRSELSWNESRACRSLSGLLLMTNCC